MPTNAKKSVYKEREFQTYVLWKSLPAFSRGMQKKELQSYGLNDPLILKIITIKNQTAFAKKFGIKDLGTLTDWNKRIKSSNRESFILNNIFKKEFEKINLDSIPKYKKVIKKNKVTKKQKTLVNDIQSSNKKEANTAQSKFKNLSEKIKDVLFKWH